MEFETGQGENYRIREGTLLKSYMTKIKFKLIVEQVNLVFNNLA